jgi:hypothetical protein
MGNTMALMMLALAAYMALGWAVVNAAHGQNPALRREHQVVQFLAVMLWVPNMVAAWRRRRQHRARWRD